MTNHKLLLIVCLLAPALSFAQQPANKPTITEPALPVIDSNACPFEGCSFGKWIVIQNATVFSTWRESRKPVGTLRKGQVVTGLTGVHITWEPDRIQIVKAIPELQVKPVDLILRYMYVGEGFADIWVEGQWKKEL